MAPRKPEQASAAEPDSGPNFEESIAALEAIVAAMEEEQLPLEELVAKYEQGTRLLARCETVLASARKRLLSIAAGGDSAEDSLDPAESLAHDAPGTPDAPDDDDDIRLF